RSSVPADRPVEGRKCFFGTKARRLSRAERRAMVERMNPALPISQQCRLLAVPRSSVYRKPAEVGAEDLTIMVLIDRHYLARPYYGSRRMAAWLATQGHRVNRKRVQRLMRLLGLAAIYQRPNTSKPAAAHKIYPYCCAGWRSSGSIRCGVPTSPTSRWPRALVRRSAKAFAVAQAS